jgi:hypothetical protein
MPGVTSSHFPGSSRLAVVEARLQADEEIFGLASWRLV